MVLEDGDVSADAWTALMTAVAFTLAEMDYSPYELRVAEMVLDRIDEHLERDLWMTVFVEEADLEDARGLAQALRRAVRDTQRRIDTNA